MAREFADNIDYSKLRAVQESVLNFGEVQSERSAQIITDNSLSFSAQDLLNLERKNIMRLSDKIRGRLAVIASYYKVPVDRMDLEQFKDTEENAFMHELAHLRRIRELRPELIEQSSINVLAVLSRGRLKVAMNVMQPMPEKDYTLTERASIMMAPVAPSDQDYADLYRRVKIGSVSQTELDEVKELIKVKPDSIGKTQLLIFLSSL